MVPTRRFEMRREMVNVTSVRRPDTTWSAIDREGHRHAWHDEDGEAGMYSPSVSYWLPTLAWVTDERGEDEDGQVVERGHHACTICDDTVEPRHTADVWDVFIPGVTHYLIDGREASREEFDSEIRAAGEVIDHEASEPHGQ